VIRGARHRLGVDRLAGLRRRELGLHLLFLLLELRLGERLWALILLIVFHDGAIVGCERPHGWAAIRWFAILKPNKAASASEAWCHVTPSRFLYQRS